MPAPKDPVKYAEFCRKLSERFNDPVKDAERRKKVSESHMGEKNNFFGKKHTEETRSKMRGQRKEVVTYSGIHVWIRTYLPIPDVCPVCRKKKRLHAHNISGEYKREISDWKYLCCRCHMIEDGRLESNMNRIKVMVHLRDPMTGRFV